mmetsp:Transcript_14379/g.35061  ORF Transcript_14379/g.35061 Transcript_14379/m.35061 type:complete len:203 (-) Transcript_14379:387-995(-)
MNNDYLIISRIFFQISAPHIHASALELLSSFSSKGSKVLDIGSGTGYVTACLARMGAEVIGIEHMKGLVEQSLKNIRRNHSDLLESKQVRILVGDARELDKRIEGTKFDAIHCGAAVEKLPQYMWSSLKDGGRIVLPIGPEDGPQYLTYVDKKSEQVPSNKDMHMLFRVLYVPITNTKWQEDRWQHITVDPFPDEVDNDEDE